jgi:hypothetical protein
MALFGFEPSSSPSSSALRFFGGLVGEGAEALGGF